MGTPDSMVGEGRRDAGPGDSHSCRRPLPLKRPLRNRLGSLAAGMLLPALMLGAAQRRNIPGPGLVEAKVRSQDSHPGCLAACHQTHGTLKGGRIPQRPSLDSICLGCHGGSPQPTADLGARKLPRVPGTASRHGRPLIEQPATAYKKAIRPGGGTAVLSDDCSACHDVHGKEPGMLSRKAFDTRGQLLGIKPVSIAQRCFGCHAGPDAAPLHLLDPDLGALFAKGSMSSHGIGRLAADRPDLPSLQGVELQGRLDCTSCHDNPDPAGPKGPHASPYPFLLKATYGREGDSASVGDRSNELCFTCHDRHSIETNRSFPLHREHIYGFTGSSPSAGRQKPRALEPGYSLPLGLRMGRVGGVSTGPFAGFGEPTPCATCHDPHGSLKNPALIQFDKSVVARSSVGGVDFYRNGLGHGTCTLTCHGYDHVQTRY